MELYVGGCGQEKLQAVLDSRKRDGERPEVFYGEDILSGRIFHCQIINHFHLIIKKLPQSDIPMLLEELYEKNPDVIIICDEVGNGIVPVEKEERLYREQVGKSCQWLAARSRRVVRIVCGCMQVLKEDGTESETPGADKTGRSVIRLCFIRHGETEGNLEKRYVGRTDEPLSLIGIENIRQLRDRMLRAERTRTKKLLKSRKEGVSELSATPLVNPASSDEGAEKQEDSCPDNLGESFRKLYISPMRRCRESAEVLFSSARMDCRKSSKVLHRHAEVDCREVFEFRECDFGAFEYRNYSELMQDEKLSPLYQAWIDSGGSLPFPEGESVEEFKERCIRAFAGVMAQNANEKSVMFIVHGGTIMAILEAYGEPEKEYYDYQVPCADGYVCDYLPEKGVITNIQRLRN